MKKIALVIISIAALVFLIACKSEEKIKFKGEVKFSELTTERTSIEFKVEVVDTINELEGAITIYLYKQSDNTQVGATTSVNSNTEEEVSFSSQLTENTTYYIRIYGIVSGKTILLFEKKDIKTLVTTNYEINSIEDFLKIKNDVRGNYVLMKNLDFTGVDFIGGSNGNKTTSFRGTFDGNGKTISNITMTKESLGTSRVALFGQLYSTATIKNLTLDHVQVGSAETPLSYTSTTTDGILVSQLDSNAVLDNITVKNASIYMTYSSTSTNLYYGGVVGRALGKISKINADVTIHSEIKRGNNLNIGGVIGEIANNATFNEVYANTDVSVDINLTDMSVDKFINLNLGGVIGSNNQQNPDHRLNNLAGKTNVSLETTKILTNSSNTLKNSGHQFNVGGLAGFNGGSLIDGYLESLVLVNEGEVAFTVPTDTEEGSEVNPISVTYKYYVSGYVGQQRNAGRQKAVLNHPNVSLTLAAESEASAFVGVIIGGFTRNITVPAANKLVVVLNEYTLTLNDETIEDPEANVVTSIEIADYITSEWLLDIYSKLN